MRLLKFSLERIYWVIFFMFVFLLTSQAIAQNKVVVIPLFGDEQQTLSPPTPVEKTGQTTSSEPGDDGDLEKGVAWPNPRFTDNGDGTVTDNLTGLIWLKNANCFGQRTWGEALSDCNGLASGSCGLTDGSSAGDWHLPNIKELQSLFHYGAYNPVLSNTAGTGQWSEDEPFTGVQSSNYWSSTTFPVSTNIPVAYYVHFSYGAVSYVDSSHSYSVWCVRGGN